MTAAARAEAEKQERLRREAYQRLAEAEALAQAIAAYRERWKIK